jgi:murein DD-endopeptidase MepM/ murein hydrolase activator NlpD
MKDQNGNEKKKMTKEKRFYLVTAIGCSLALVAIIVVALALSGNNVEAPSVNNSGALTESTGGNTNVDKDSGVGNSSSDKPVVNTPEGMVMPLETVSVVNDYGFYHNTTLNKYYEHQGVDFTAEVGTEVLAAEAGVVESIYRDDVLTGTEIVIDHGNGLKTVYRFVTAAEDLTVGARVEKGEVIAVVAEATGEEYKDGAHLHFEVKKDGKQVDPATYLTFEEK